MPPLPPNPPLEPLLALWGLLAGGFAYAAWFRRSRVAWGFGLLAWVTAGCLSGALLLRIGLGDAASLAALNWQLVPWVVLLVAVVPTAWLRTRFGLALGLLLAGQLVVAALFLPDSGTIPDLEQAVLSLVPAGLRGWLTPLAPVLCVLACVAAFVRWQLSDDLADLAFFGAATVLLVGILRPEQGGVAVAIAGGVLLGALVVLAHRMAFVDALTGLPNRRALETTLSALPRRYAIAMADIDHFKSINDRHGHDVGDQVLRMAASRLRHARGLRVYRYGGEEFCLLVRGRAIRDARRLCEEARLAVADPPMVLRDAGRPTRRPRRGARRKSVGKRKTVGVTISIGLAFAAAGATPAQTIEIADKALYRAKKAGRDRVVTSGKPSG